MTKIAIVYYSTYGHIVPLAEAIKQGTDLVVGVDASIYQIQPTLRGDAHASIRAPPKDGVPDHHASHPRGRRWHSLWLPDAVWCLPGAGQGLFRLVR
jgi:hypothetical protein